MAPRMVDRLAASPRNRAVLVAGLTLLAGGLTAAASWQGPGMTVDSVRYAAAARSLATSGAALGLDGSPLVVFPPGLPAILSVAERLGVGVAAGAVLLGVAVAVGLVIATYWVADRALGSSTLALLPAAIVAVAPATTAVNSRLWSEGSFTLALMLATLLLTSAVRDRRLGALTAVGVVASVWAATLIRYLGVALLPVAAVGAALACRGRGAWRALACAIALAGASSLAIVALVIRNQQLTGTSFGARSSASSPLAESIRATLGAIGGHLVPDLVPGVAAVLAVPIGIGVLLLAAVGTGAASRHRDAALAVPVTVVASYMGALLLSALLARFDAIDMRLTYPMMPVLVILAVAGGRALLAGRTGAAAVLARVVVVGLLVLALPAALMSSVWYARTMSVLGYGYAAQAVVESDTVRALRSLPADLRIATNDPFQVYWTTGRQPVRPGEGFAGADVVVVFDTDVNGVTRQSLDVDAARTRLLCTTADGRLFAVVGATLTPGRGC